MISASKNRQQGFTLIELLVVIAIIGLLASVIMVSLVSARSKGRDAKRVEDMRQLASAMELYAADNNGQYPNAVTASNGAYVAGWTTLLNNYVGKMPADPNNVTAQYGYYYAVGYKPTGNCSFVSTGSLSDYILATRLENSNTTPAQCQTVFSGWDNNNLNFILGQ